MMNITRGAILWADAPDRNGFVKDRPMVVVAIDADPATPIVCCCITTKGKKPKPQKHMRIPWDVAGKSATGLKKPSFAVADWLIEVARADVRRITGELQPAHFRKLLDLIAEFAR